MQIVIILLSILCFSLGIYSLNTSFTGLFFLKRRSLLLNAEARIDLTIFYLAGVALGFIVSFVSLCAPAFFGINADPFFLSLCFIFFVVYKIYQYECIGLPIY